MTKMKIGKKAKGMMTFIAIIILLAIALAGSMIYENKVTANAISQLEVSDKTIVYYTNVESVDDLEFLNEGWYQIKKGYVYYLEYFDNAIPIFVKVKNPLEQNGMLVVNLDGTTSFDDSFAGLPEAVYENPQSKSNEITGDATGFEAVTGNQVVYTSIETALKERDFGDEFIVGGVKYRKANGVVPQSISPTETAPLAVKISNPSVGTDGTKNFVRDPTDDKYKYVEGIDLSLKTQTIKGTTYYFTQEGVYLGPGGMGKQAYDEYLHGQSNAQAPTAPNSAPPAPVTTTSAPTRPAPNPANVPVGGTVATLANDGNYYYRETAQGPLLIWNPSTKSYDTVKNWYTVTYTLSGQTRTTTIQAATESEARTIISQNRPGIQSIGVKKAVSESPSSQTATQAYYASVYDENTKSWVVSNGRTSQEFENELDAQAYMTEQNQISRVNLEYNNWLKKNNLQDSQHNKEIFYKYPPQGVEKEAIPKALNFNINEKRPVDQVKYTAIEKPDGSGYLFELPDGRRFESATNQPPEELKAILDFQKNHPTARLDAEGRKTETGRPVFVENGKFIDETGKPVTQFVKDVQIGGEKYKVHYEVRDGKISATGIDVAVGGAEPIMTPVTQEQLSLIQQNVAQGDIFHIGANSEISITKKEREFSGKNGAKGTINENILITPKGATIESTSSEKDSSGNIVSLSKTTTVSERDNKGKLVSKTESRRNYILGPGQTHIDSQTGDFSQITKNTQTGEPLEVQVKKGETVYYIEYTKDGTKVYKGVEGELPSRNVFANNDDLPEEVKKQLSEHAKWTSRRAIAGFERALTEFRGLGYIPTLFGFNDEVLRDWRNDVDEAFSKYNLGTEYWASNICGKYIDDEGIGVAYANTPQGLAQIGAHIQATRTEAINNGSNTYYIYRITFNVRNGDFKNDLRAPEELRFNVHLKRSVPAGKVAIPVILFNKELNVSRGGTYGRTGDNAIVQESEEIFSEICMKFSSPLPSRWNIENDELCTPIQVGGSPTKIRQSQATGTKGDNDAPVNDF